MLRIVADKIEELPEGLRSAAKQQGQSVVVDAMPEGWAIEDITALKGAITTERSTRKELERKIKDFEGIEDPASAREALEAMQAGRLKSSKEIEEWKKSAEAKFAQDAAKIRAQSDGLTKQLRELLVDRAAMQAIVEAGGNPKLLLPIVRGAAKSEMTENGTFSVSLIGDDGKELMTRQAGSSAPMQFSEYVNTLRENPDYKSAFAGSGVGGSGANHASGGTARVAVPGSSSARELFTRAANTA